MIAGASSGAVYQLEREAMARRVQDHSQRLPGSAPPYTTAFDLGNGRLALGALGGASILHYRPGEPRQSLQAIQLPGPMTCPVVAWRNGFVAATEVGQVFLYDAETAAPAATPFQPELRPGRKYHWLQPAVIGAGEASRLAVSDGRSKIYLLGFVAEPEPHLEALAAADVGASPLVSPLAVSGERVFAGAEDGKLAIFAAADLAPSEPIALGGRVIWGPHGAEGGLLLAVDTGELMLVAPDGAIRWRRPVEHGPLGGTPLIVDSHAFALHPSGGLSRINLADGAEQSFTDLGQPAVAGPVAYGERLIVSAPDGTLLVVNRP
jgi:hypothetical protein